MPKTTEVLTLHQALAPLHCLTSVLFISPFRFKKGKISKLWKIDKFFAVVLVTITVLYIFWSIYGKAVYFCSDPRIHIPCVFDIIFTLPGHILIILSIILSNLRSGKPVLSFYKKLEVIDAQYFTREECNYHSLRKRIIITIAFSYSTATLISAPEVYITIAQMGIYKASYFICLNFSYYITLAIVMQVTMKARLLYQRFDALNKRLMVFQIHQPATPQDLRNLCKIHLELCDLIKTFNKIHGLEAAFIYSCATFLILLCLNVGLWADNLLHNVSNDLGHVLRILKGISAVAYLLPVLALSKICSDARDTAARIGCIAHKLLLGMAVEDKLFKDELQLIVDQVMRNDLNFSASGLFIIDWTAVYSVFGSVTSYFIVLLQFKGVSQ